MTEKKREPAEDEKSCPDHPKTIPGVGYGLAGGGIGAYSYCPECYRILSKTQDPEMEPQP